MSLCSCFEFNDNDIVTLQPETPDSATTGWVNVGTHSIHIEMSESGDLTVNAYPREAEGANNQLGTINVTKQGSVDAGGENPDE